MQIFVTSYMLMDKMADFNTFEDYVPSDFKLYWQRSSANNSGRRCFSISLSTFQTILIFQN